MTRGPDRPSRRAVLAIRLRPPITRWFRAGVVSQGRDRTDEAASGACIVFAPHPDDETLGCGALIARKRASGTRVQVVVATDGRYSHRSSIVSADELARLRAEESVEACSVLGVGVGDVTMFGFEEGSITTRYEELRSRIADVLKRSPATEVYVTCRHDWHPDHRALREAVIDAVASGGAGVQVYEYPIWFLVDGPWRPFDSATLLEKMWRFVLDPLWARLRLHAILVETGPFAETKRAALRAYRTQTTRFTDETDWAVLDDEFLELFSGRYEIFLPAEP